MWNRVSLKERGRRAFMRNYWRCVGIALVLLLFVSQNRDTDRDASDHTSYNQTYESGNAQNSD